MYIRFFFTNRLVHYILPNTEWPLSWKSGKSQGKVREKSGKSQGKRKRAKIVKEKSENLRNTIVRSFGEGRVQVSIGAFWDLFQITL